MSGFNIAGDLDVIEFSNPKTIPFRCSCGNEVQSVPSDYSPNNPHTVRCGVCGRERRCTGRLVDERLIKHEPNP
jgi:hypothetical protein